MVATCEVYGLFHHLIPQEVRTKVMIPDYRVELPNTLGLTTNSLNLGPVKIDNHIAEPKYYCGKALYKPVVKTA